MEIDVKGQLCSMKEHKAKTHVKDGKEEVCAHACGTERESKEMKKTEVGK